MVWPLLLALGGGAVADGYLNHGNITRNVGSVVGSAFQGILTGGNDTADGNGNWDLMSLLGNSEVLKGGGGLAGALTLSFTPGVPDFVKKLAWGAAIMNLVYQAYKMFVQKDFSNANDPRTNVLKTGFDPSNPDIVGQTHEQKNPNGPLLSVEADLE